MIYFHLGYNNFEDELYLPINPGSFQLANGQTVTTTEIIGLGEAAQIGNERLSTIEIASYFPLNPNSLCTYQNIPDPYVAVNKILGWQKSGRPIRLIISETPINMPVVIKDFTYQEEGGTRNVNFTLSLMEYKFVQVPKVTALVVEEHKIMKPPAVKTKRATKPINSKIYVTKSGDTLEIVARRLTGTYENAKVIEKDNKSIISYIKGSNGIFYLKPGLKLTINMGRMSTPSNKTSNTITMG